MGPESKRVIDTEARRLIRLHLDQALSLAVMLEETLLVALITEAAEYCDSRGFAASPVAGIHASMQ